MILPGLWPLWCCNHRLNRGSNAISSDWKESQAGPWSQNTQPANHILLWLWLWHDSQQGLEMVQQLTMCLPLCSLFGYVCEVFQALSVLGGFSSVECPAFLSKCQCQSADRLVPKWLLSVHLLSRTGNSTNQDGWDVRISLVVQKPQRALPHTHNVLASGGHCT